jgi:Flp pilus assembly protein TadG
MTGNTVKRRSSAQQGSITLELAIVTPALLLILMLLIAGGRLSSAHGQTEEAARDAARAASLARDPATAQQAAQAAAHASVVNQNLSCSALNVSVSGDFSAPAGSPAAVTATVDCQVSLNDLALLPIPGSKQVSASYTSVLDTYRARE